MCHNRSESDTLTSTQDFLAIMLAVNPPSLTTTAIAFQDAGFIKYPRGKLKILDREGLEDFACDCYGVVKSDCDKLEK